MVETRLESKVFSLERLYPLFPVEVSQSQTNIGSKEILGQIKHKKKKIQIAVPNIFGLNIFLGLKKFSQNRVSNSWDIADMNKGC